MTQPDQIPLTEPLTPDDCNLRGLPYMPLDVVRFLESDLVGVVTPQEGWAAILLWARSWLQVPAASLPDNDRQLARWAGLSEAEWREVRTNALRGWRRASNGRLYHPVVAEKALSAWIERLRLQQKSALGNASQGRASVDPASFDEPIGQGLRLLASLNPGEATKLDRAPRGPRSTSGETHRETPGESDRDTSGETQRDTPPETLAETEVEGEVEVEGEGEGKPPFQRSGEVQGLAQGRNEPIRGGARQTNRAGFSGQAWAVEGRG